MWGVPGEGGGAVGSNVGSVWDHSGIRLENVGSGVWKRQENSWDPAGVLSPFIILKGLRSFFKPGAIAKPLAHTCAASSLEFFRPVCAHAAGSLLMKIRRTYDKKVP